MLLFRLVQHLMLRSFRQPELSPPGPTVKRGRLVRSGYGDRVAVQLNHTIVSAVDAEVSARWLAEMLDLAEPEPAGHFWQVMVANGLGLDFASVPDGEPVVAQHYAFLISEPEFDAVHGRLLAGDHDMWADPRQRYPGEINHNDGGRGVYFLSNDGHYLEVLTRPYGSGEPEPPSAPSSDVGEADLGHLLATMRPTIRDGEFVFVSLESPTELPALPALATIAEAEGTTYVLTRADADGRGLSYDFVAAWITLQVHSALEAVGLTAAFSTALAEAGISCNVLAGFHHDHLLVPHDQATDAIAVLERLSAP